MDFRRDPLDKRRVSECDVEKALGFGHHRVSQGVNIQGITFKRRIRNPEKFSDSSNRIGEYRTAKVKNKAFTDDMAEVADQTARVKEAYNKKQPRPFCGACFVVARCLRFCEFCSG